MNESAKQDTPARTLALKEDNWLPIGVLIGIIVLAINWLETLLVKVVPDFQDGATALILFSALNLVLGVVLGGRRSQYTLITAMAFLLAVFTGLAGFLPAMILVIAFGTGGFLRGAFSANPP